MPNEPIESISNQLNTILENIVVDSTMRTAAVAALLAADETNSLITIIGSDELQETIENDYTGGLLARLQTQILNDEETIVVVYKDASVANVSQLQQDIKNEAKLSAIKKILEVPEQLKLDFSKLPKQIKEDLLKES